MHHLADVRNPYEFYMALDVQYCGPAYMPTIAQSLSSQAQEPSQASQAAGGGAADDDLDRLFGFMMRVTQCDDWPVRQRKREAGIYHVKNTAEYQRAQDGLSMRHRPATPDHTDRSISKRSWERGMQMWREALRAIVDDQ